MRFTAASRGAYASAVVASLLAASAWLAGCTPSIGDSCALSTDCASDGTRVCDTSEPGGFCTVLNCTGNSLGSDCPDNAFCILFSPNVPGCPDSVRSPSRLSVAQCRNTCSTDSDCRAGYFCRNPAGPPWYAEVLDPIQNVAICMPVLSFIDGGTSPVGYAYTGAPDAVSPVCQSAGPTFDAGFPPLDAAVDAGVDAAAKTDAKADAKARDGAVDAKGDAKIDATLDAGGRDAAKDARQDTLAPDAHRADAAADAHDAGAPG